MKKNAATTFAFSRRSTPRPLVVAMVIPLAASCVLAAPPESVREQLLTQTVRIQQVVGALERTRRPNEIAFFEGSLHDPPHQTWSESQRQDQDDTAAAHAATPTPIHFARPTQGSPWGGSLPHKAFPPSTAVRGPPAIGDIS